MRIQTKHFLEKAWNALSHGEGHCWNNKQDFIAWAEDQAEVDARAYNTYLTKLDPKDLLGPDNATVVNVSCDADWNLILTDSIPFMEDEV